MVLGLSKTYPENPESWPHVHHPDPFSEGRGSLMHGLGCDLRQVYDRQLRRKGRWLLDRSVLGSSEKQSSISISRSHWIVYWLRCAGVQRK